MPFIVAYIGIGGDTLRRLKFMRRLVVPLLALVVLPGTAAAASDIDSPAPPEGFTWKKVSKIKGAFLIPDGWHFKHTETGGTLGYFITKEDIDKSGRFETGLTVNVFVKRKSPDAVAWAKGFIETEARRNEVLEGPYSNGASTLKRFGVRVRVTSQGDPPLIMDFLVIGNEKTNTLYVMFFESPEGQWDEAWKIGEWVLRVNILDDEE